MQVEEMSQRYLQTFEKFVPKNYVQQAAQNEQSQENEIRILLEKVKYFFKKNSLKSI